MCLPFPWLPYKVYIGQGMVPSLFLGLINAMWPTPPNTTWYTICRHVTMLFWSSISPNAHLCRRTAWGIKTMWPWMHKFWITQWFDFTATNKRQLLGSKRHVNLKWGKLHVVMGDTLEVPKPTLVKLAFNAKLDILGMITWSVGSIPFNVQAKVDHYEDLAIVIQAHSNWVCQGTQRCLEWAWLKECV